MWTEYGLMSRLTTSAIGPQPSVSCFSITSTYHLRSINRIKPGASRTSPTGKDHDAFEAPWRDWLPPCGWTREEATAAGAAALTDAFQPGAPPVGRVWLPQAKSNERCGSDIPFFRINVHWARLVLPFVGWLRAEHGIRKWQRLMSQPPNAY